MRLDARDLRRRTYGTNQQYPAEHVCGSFKRPSSYPSSVGVADLYLVFYPLNQLTI